MYEKIYLCLLTLCICVSCSTKSTESTPARAELTSIPLELTTHLGDKQHFIEGDEIQFLLSIGQDAYVYMIYIDADNRITQILPNPNQQSHFYSAGYFLTIPEYDDLYRFTISEPYGDESIWVFASDQSIIIEPSLKSIETIKSRIQHTSKQAYGEYVLRITTSEMSRR